MKTIQLDLSTKDTAPVILAKQGDVGRKFKAVITDAGVEYPIPAGAQFSVWFSGPSGEGNYSAIGEASAFAVDCNTVTVELITQMLKKHGTGILCLVLNAADGSQLGLWNVIYVVEHVPGMDSEAAEDYYTALSELAHHAINAAAKFETDTTLSVPGKAADAAAVGAALEAAQMIESPNHPGCYYRMVNGVTEWLNPPMELGVEYRTTERVKKKPSYVKLVDIGYMPKNSVKTVAHGIADLEYCFPPEGWLEAGGYHVSTPYYESPTSYANLSVTDDNVSISTSSTDISAWRGFAVLKYTKTSDQIA